MIITDGKSSLTIKNAFISREFSLENKRLKTVAIHNLISGKTLNAQKNSSEFEVCFGGFPGHRLDGSKLKLADVISHDDAADSEVQFVFKSVTVSGCKLDVRLFVTLRAGDSYMRRWLVIKTDTPCDAKLESVRLDLFEFDPLIKSWHINEQKGGCDTPSDELKLGQPVYVDTMFFGCEFPAAYNTVDDNLVSLCYSSGKSLSALCDNNSFVSWPCICGSAASDDYNVLQHDFFEYIRDIALPGGFRRQYNSWYDYMYDINDHNLEASFLEIDKGCSRFGVKPLDAYVADDGWNDYSGSFWGFNSKFPDELFVEMRLTHALGSTFGLWLGPRGGYNNEVYSFAKKIESAGKGHVNLMARDICVASSTYLDNLGKLLVDYTERFDLSYWKLDGFCRRPCRSKKHGHITGGKNNCYYYTELWEHWIDIFNSMRKCREKQGKTLWLNITCYVNPSPWFLQWVNSVWMQNSYDVGFAQKSNSGEKLGGSDKDKMLTYRDDKYNDFYNVRQFQFPQSNLYNHDPIYGKNAKVSMTDNEFCEFLMMNACRGTSFWELYYTPEMMNDEKWAINAAVLSWAEKHRAILATSRLIGNEPLSGNIYGYSCWRDNEGVVALRNPSGKNASFTLYLDEKCGVTKSASALQVSGILGKTDSSTASYGDTVTVSLSPYELRVISFGSAKPLIIAQQPAPATEITDGMPVCGDSSFTIKAFVESDTSGVIYAQGDELSLNTDSDGHFVFTVGGAQLISESTRDNTALITAVRENNGAIKLYANGKLEAGAYVQGKTDCPLSGSQRTVSAKNKVIVMNGALSYDEV